MPYFGCGKCVKIDRWETGPQIAEQFLVPLQPERGVVAALQEYLVAAQGDGLLDFLVQHFTRQYVGIAISGLPVEGAEVADSSADIGVVDVAVDVVGAIRFGVQHAAYGIGRTAQSHEVAAVKERHALL